MADNRLKGVLRDCEKLSWDTFPVLLSPVSWLRECSVLYQGNQLRSPWRHNAGFPPSYLYAKLTKAGACWNNTGAGQDGTC